MDYSKVVSPKALEAGADSGSDGAAKAKVLQKRRSAKKRAKSFKMKREVEIDRKKLDRMLSDSSPSKGGSQAASQSLMWPY